MKRISLILLTALLAVGIGTSVAYYNTSSLGYDDFNILTVTDEDIKILYIDIKYENVKKALDLFEKCLPDNFITI